MTPPAFARQRVADGADRLGIAIDDACLDQFAAFAAVLEDGRKRLNLTSISGPDDVADKLFLDSLTALLGLGAVPARGARFIDVGTGAGFPGVPIAIALPGVGVTLLDATARKAAWLDEAVRAVGIGNAWGVAGRAEEVGQRAGWRGEFDVATARAVAPLATLAELMIPLLRPGGHAIALKTRSAIALELPGAEHALAEVGGTVAGVVAVPDDVLPNRAVVTMVRVADVPSQYPRRPGLPARLPLGTGAPGSGGRAPHPRPHA